MKKSDCNSTAEFFKTLLRACHSAESDCKGCPFEKCNENPYNSYNCQDFIQMHTKDAIQLLQKWSDEHPEETLLSLFKKDHPKAPLWNGVPGCDPIVLGYLPETMRDFVNSTGAKIWEIPIDELEKVSACKDKNTAARKTDKNEEIPTVILNGKEIPVSDKDMETILSVFSPKKTVNNNGPSVDNLTDELIKLLDFIID